jgi:conjugal transfer pilus assembly protein TrbC
VPRSRSRSRSARAASLALLASAALVAPALGQALLPAQMDVDTAIGAARARSGEVFQRLDDRAPVLRSSRALPSAPEAPGRAPDPAVIAERYRASAATPSHTGPALLVFVSFSMPHASLLRLAEQSSRANAVLVFRGLAGTSLRQMAERLQPLAKTGATLQIDPEAFTRFGVEIVPTFVLAERASGCGETACDGLARRVAGDVSLDHALERLARSGDTLAHAADARLRQLRGAGQ